MITPEEERRWLAIERDWEKHCRRTRGVGDNRIYAPLREYFLLHFERPEAQAVRRTGNAVFKAVDGGGRLNYVDIVRAALADLRYVEILLADAPDDLTKRDGLVAEVALHVAFEIGRLGDLLEARLPGSRTRKL